MYICSEFLVIIVFFKRTLQAAIIAKKNLQIFAIFYFYDKQ